MDSFLEKLKKGMADEEIADETVEAEETVEEPAEKPVKRESRKKTKEPELKIKKIKIQTRKSEKKEADREEKKQEWPVRNEESGQLAIDVCQTEEELIIQSAIAGVKAEDLDISVEKDVLSIKGRRKNPNEEKSDYFIKECFWGLFSRETILPVEVDPGRVKAEIKNGILTIKMPKIIREDKRKIVIEE